MLTNGVSPPQASSDEDEEAGDEEGDKFDESH